HLNVTRFAVLDVAIFNRPTRVDSEQLIPLIQELSKLNDINVVLNGPIRSMNRTRTPSQQMIEADWVSDLEGGTLYMIHAPWSDFTEFGQKKPVYISMVRDPIDRIIEDYYERRSTIRRAIYRHIYPGRPQRTDNWYRQSFNECVRSGDPECQYLPGSIIDYVEDFKRQSLFFCGNHINCLPFNSPFAVQMAKRNVEKEYAVVGTWEEKNITLTVLEKYVPKYFNHARFIYKLNKTSIKNRNRNNRKPKVDADVREMVRRNFTYEYEFYNFCKQRLYKQYLALQFEDNLK
ncbi:uncharacterized protein Dwil_GK19619, partial [Drosophila willistoni]